MLEDMKTSDVRGLYCLDYDEIGHLLDPMTIFGMERALDRLRKAGRVDNGTANTASAKKSPM